jgi:hypothetical protein
MRLRGSENNNFLQGIAMNTERQRATWTPQSTASAIDTRFNQYHHFHSGTSFTIFDLKMSKDEFLKFPARFLPKFVD